MVDPIFNGSNNTYNIKYNVFEDKFEFENQKDNGSILTALHLAKQQLTFSAHIVLF